MDAHWYCIRTATRQEQKVIDGLRDLARERRIELDAYLPCETRWNRTARVRSTKQVPMLPGYLFLKIEEDQLWRVDELDGVYQILGWGARQTVRETARLVDFVTELREAEDAGLFDKTQAPAHKRLKLERGELARVCGGQFSGHIVQIMEKTGPEKVRVLFTIFGRAAPMILPVKDLEPQHAGDAEAA